MLSEIDDHFEFGADALHITFKMLKFTAFRTDFQPNFPLILILSVVVILVGSCSTEPETVIETVVHEATIQIEVTRPIEQEVVVTRESGTCQERV